MNFPFLFDYPKHMIYPDGDRLAFESYSDSQYIPGIACCLHLFENFRHRGRMIELFPYRDVIPGRKRKIN